MKLSLLATNRTDRTISVSVDGVLYEYWISGDLDSLVQTIKKLASAGAHGKIINLLKARSYKFDKLG